MNTATRTVDVLVGGGGVAGLSAALGSACTRRVLVVDAAQAEGGSTRWAQGGIVVAVDAGDTRPPTPPPPGCDLQALDVPVEEGPQRVADLLAAGALVDRTPDGSLATRLEGGHQRRRVVHAGGDATGAGVVRR